MAHEFVCAQTVCLGLHGRQHTHSSTHRRIFDSSKTRENANSVSLFGMCVRYSTHGRFHPRAPHTRSSNAQQPSDPRWPPLFFQCRLTLCARISQGRSTVARAELEDRVRRGRGSARCVVPAANARSRASAAHVAFPFAHPTLACRGHASVVPDGCGIVFATHRQISDAIAEHATASMTIKHVCFMS